MTWEPAIVLLAILIDFYLMEVKHGNPDSRRVVLVIPVWIARVLGRVGGRD